jgi:aminopeptidase N
MYILARLANIYDSLGGFEIPEGGDDHLTSLTRSLVLNWACQLGHKNCNENAVGKFSDWKEKPNPDIDNP